MSESPDYSSRAGRPKLPAAKWGAACAACATAKAKCIRSDTTPGSKCDRCQRLFKECAVQVHRPRKKRQVKPSRTAQIEERLNGLVNLLKASGDLSKADLSPENLRRQLTTDEAASSSSSKAANNPWAIPDTYNAYAPPSCVCRPKSGDAPPPPDSDEHLLEIYRNELFPHHPFVAIPPSTTAAMLAAERPFLMSAIRMVSSFRSLRSMRAQMYHLLKHIGDHMLIRSERSLDMLLGLIVIIGWYQYHCFMHAQLGNLIGLAISLIGEMGLSRPPTVTERANLMVVLPEQAKPRTNEEKRALAGVWFLSSTMSIGFQRIESLRFTRYLQSCLTELETEMEFETDLKLVQYLRIQHLTERIAIFNDKDGEIEEVTTFPAAPTPRATYINAFQLELDSIKESLPARFRADTVIRIYLQSAALRLYEPPKVDQSFIEALTMSLAAPYGVTSSLLDELYRTHAIMIDWFDRWTAIPISSYYSHTLPTYTLIIYSISMLGRWAKLFTPRAPRQGPSTPMPDDPSAVEQSVSTPGSSASAISPAAGPTRTPMSSGSDMSDVYNLRSVEESLDSMIPAAVVSLQTLVERHPGLIIDIPQILTTLQSRIMQVSASIKRCAVEGESKDPNLWSVSAVKMLIVKVKLERWAELVAEDTEALTLEDLATQDAIMGEVDGQLLQDGYLQDSMDFGAAGGMPWMADLMEGSGDNTGWFGGYMDWGVGGMNPPGMNPPGNVDQ